MKTRSGAACCLAALALAGCSAHVSGSVGVGNGVSTTAPTVDSTKMASVVERFTQTRGLAAQTVSCPGNIPEQAGRVTTCVAYYKGGQTGLFRVRQKDGQGNIHVTAAEMIGPEVVLQIERYLQPPPISVTCPQHVPIVVGQAFRCTARRGAQTATVLVRITDAGGGFRLSGVS